MTCIIFHVLCSYVKVKIELTKEYSFPQNLIKPTEQLCLKVASLFLLLYSTPSAIAN